MSRTRSGLRPEDWHDDGASVGRITFTRYGVKGGPVYGSHATGESTRDRDLRLQREWKARHPKP